MNLLRVIISVLCYSSIMYATENVGKKAETIFLKNKIVFKPGAMIQVVAACPGRLTNRARVIGLITCSNPLNLVETMCGMRYCKAITEKDSWEKIINATLLVGQKKERNCSLWSCLSKNILADTNEIYQCTYHATDDKSEKYEGELVYLHSSWMRVPELEERIENEQYIAAGSKNKAAVTINGVKIRH